MVTVAGVDAVAVPTDGVTDSQPEPSVVLTLVVNDTSTPLVPTATVLEAGAAPPSVWLKEREVGVTDMVAAVTVRVTGTVTGLSRTPAVVAVTVTALEY